MDLNDLSWENLERLLYSRKLNHRFNSPHAKNLYHLPDDYESNEKLREFPYPERKRSRNELNEDMG